MTQMPPQRNMEIMLPVFMSYVDYQLHNTAQNVADLCIQEGELAEPLIRMYSSCIDYLISTREEESSAIAEDQDSTAQMLANYISQIPDERQDSMPLELRTIIDISKEIVHKHGYDNLMDADFGVSKDYESLSQEPHKYDPFALFMASEK
jgi:hypothetical protein